MNYHHGKKQELNYLFVVVVRINDFKNIIKISTTFLERAMSKWFLRKEKCKRIEQFSQLICK